MMRRSSGFTLIELVLTVVLTGIIATMLVVVSKQPLQALWSVGDTLNRQSPFYLAFEDLSVQLHTPATSLTLKSEKEKDTLTVFSKESSLQYECDRNQQVLRKIHTVAGKERSGLLFKRDSCFFELQPHPRGWTLSVRIESQLGPAILRRIYVPKQEA